MYPRSPGVIPVLALLIAIGTSACTAGAGSSAGLGTPAPETPTTAPTFPAPPDAWGAPPEAGAPRDAGAAGGAQAPAPGYTIEQGISDRAQQNTIAFDALGFLTGSLGADSFFPPGKVADFWGFQYLRDNDPSQMGHNTDFLTRASIDMLAVLTAPQRQRLIALARSQVPAIQEYGNGRFVLMQAFRRLLEGDLPSGTSGLDEAAVKTYSASLYALDGRISLERAEVMGELLAGLTTTQRATLDYMVGKGMTSWPEAAEPAELAGLSRDEKEAVMTYAGDMFSWYAGSVEADTYFCPERHGTYFGSFYLKDAPAVGNPGYSIGTTITGDLGATLLAKLDATQAGLISGLVDAQRPSLLRIVDTRRAISTELRESLAGGSPDSTAVGTLMTTYGELDGSIAYDYATAFAKVGQTLTAAQKAELEALRTQLLGNLAAPTGAYLFSQPVPMPTIPSTDFLFK
jgi:Spy/CpxP family protein refolding chaperone